MTGAVVFVIRPFRAHKQKTTSGHQTKQPKRIVVRQYRGLLLRLGNDAGNALALAHGPIPDDPLVLGCIGLYARGHGGVGAGQLLTKTGQVFFGAYGEKGR